MEFKRVKEIYRHRYIIDELVKKYRRKLNTCEVSWDPSGKYNDQKELILHPDQRKLISDLEVWRHRVNKPPNKATIRK